MKKQSNDLLDMHLNSSKFYKRFIEKKGKALNNNKRASELIIGNTEKTRNSMSENGL